MTAQQQAEQQVAETQAGRGDILPMLRPISGKRGESENDAQANPALPLPGNSKALCEIVVDKLFDKPHWAAEWALELCIADPYFLTHIADQPNGYAHYLCVLRLAFTDAGDHDMRECARAIRTTNKKKLLKACFPSRASGILNVLPKLPKKPMPEAFYRRLIRALADESKREHFSHAKRVRAFDFQLFDMMKILPAQFQSGAAHCRNADDYGRLCMLIECANRLNLEFTEREFGAVAKQVRHMRGLWRYLARKAAKMPFPPPPWNGDDNIRPLCSRRELKEAGERFENCAAEYAFKVVAGRSYLYVCEQTPAMIEIVNDVFFGWGVGTIEKAKRKSISSAKAFEIKRAFHNAGICQATMSVDDFEDTYIGLRYAGHARSIDDL